MTDQAELDKQYSPSQWCTRISPDQVVQAHVDKLERGTRACQDHWPADQLELNVPYGGAPSSLASSKNMLLDIYHPHPDKDTHHVVFYIHGGYWVALHKDQSGWFADPVAEAGVTLVSVNYDLCPNVTFETIVAQVQQAFTWTCGRFPDSEITLCGHSAGAHLAALVMLMSNMKERVSRAILVSGVYDLLPIQQSCVNDPLQLTAEDITQYSPQRILERMMKTTEHPIQILVAVGDSDSPEFQRQSYVFSQSLRSIFALVTYQVLAKADHFDIIEQLEDRHYSLTKDLLSRDDPKIAS